MSVFRLLNFILAYNFCDTLPARANMCRICVSGGFTMKIRFLGWLRAPYVKCIGMARAPYLRMVAKTIGRHIGEGIPCLCGRFEGTGNRSCDRRRTKNILAKKGLSRFQRRYGCLHLQREVVTGTDRSCAEAVNLRYIFPGMILL